MFFLKYKYILSLNKSIFLNNPLNNKSTFKKIEIKYYLKNLNKKDNIIYNVYYYI